MQVLYQFWHLIDQEGLVSMNRASGQARCFGVRNPVQHIGKNRRAYERVGMRAFGICTFSYQSCFSMCGSLALEKVRTHHSSMPASTAGSV